MSHLIIPWHNFEPFLVLNPRTWISETTVRHAPLHIPTWGSCRNASQPPFLWKRQAQSTQLLLVRHAFQLFTRKFTLHSPPLDMFEDLHVLLQCWGPALHTGLHVRLQHCWILWDNPLSGLAGCAMCDVSSRQFALSAAWAHCFLLLSLWPICTPRSFSALQSLSKFRLVPSVTPSQPQKIALGLLPFHAWDSPMLQFIKILLWGLLFLKKVNGTSWFDIVSMLMGYSIPASG